MKLKLSIALSLCMVGCAGQVSDEALHYREWWLDCTDGGEDFLKMSARFSVNRFTLI